MSTEVKKVYIAIHRETGKVWCGRKSVYEKIGGLKAAWKTAAWKSHRSPELKDEYDIYSYELKDGKLEN
jgi:hypothetical protein